MKLSQILAIERNVKGRCEKLLTGLYHSLAKVGELVMGFIKNYKPKDEDGEKLPSEKKLVTLYIDKALVEARKGIEELFDIRAMKDATNCIARADVIVGSTTLLKDVPATHLLYMEKELQQTIIPLIEKIPALDPSETWTWEENQGLYVTAPSEALRKEKLQKPLVMYQATVQHPAQVQMITEDKVTGTWTHIKLSSARPKPEIEKALAQAITLQKAVKFAREQANMAEVVEFKTGKVVFDFIFGG